MADFRADRRFAWVLVTPALATVAGVAVFPLAWTIWESLHRHDLRMPWLGRPFVGLANYGEILADRRFWEALGHTVLFTAASVTLEILLGLALALAMNRAFRGRGLVRAAVLVPWAIPTVVAALLWRFLFDSQAGIANAFLDEPIVWFNRAATAWMPIILADVWKTTPFVALLLLAGLQNIDPAVYEAAEVDGAGAWRRLRSVTLPLLKPALLVALIFRTLDAFRVFDLVYVLTGGGPGTATEPIALYTFNTFFANLRFGYGAALSVIVFLVTFLLAMLYVRGLGVSLGGEER
jgi:ABC-type sugar transport system permease subunit